VLAHIALAKGQRLLFSCPSPVKSPPHPKVPLAGSALAAAPPVMAEPALLEPAHLADNLEPTYA
jgi:hypothetical protein